MDKTKIAVVALISTILAAMAIVTLRPSGSAPPAVVQPPAPIAQVAVNQDDIKPPLRPPEVASDPSTAPTDADVAQLISEFVGKMRMRYAVLESLRAIQMSQMRQAAQFSDLDKYRKSAESIKEDAMSARQDIETYRRDMVTDTNDAQSAILDALGDEADKYAGSVVDVSVDLAVHANSGLDMMGEMTKDSNESVRVKREFENLIRSSYKKLGVKPRDIEKDTLMLKAS